MLGNTRIRRPPPTKRAVAGVRSGRGPASGGPMFQGEVI